MNIDHPKRLSNRPRGVRKNIQAVVFLGFFLIALAGAVWRVYPAVVNMVTPEVERLLREGDQYLAENRLSEAVLTYRQAVEIDGKNQDALRSLISAYRNQGRERMASRYQAKLEEGVSMPARSSVDLPEALPGFLEPSWIHVPFEGTPTGGTVSSNYLIIAYEEGVIAALDVQTGQPAWISQVEHSITSAPAVGRDLVMIGMGDGTVKALDPGNGVQRWSYGTGGPIYAPPAFDDATVFVASSDGSLYAIDQTNGQLSWKFSTQGGLHGSPEVAEGVVYFGSLDGKIYAVDTSTGAPVWKDGILTSGPIEAQPIYYRGRLVTGSGDGRVYSMDPGSGGQYWRVSTPDAIFTQPLPLEDTLYVASSGRRLLALDFETGARIWEVDFPVPLRNPPASTEQAIFQVGDGDAALYIIDPKSGATIGKVQTRDWITAGPWIQNDILFLVGKDGAGMAFRLVE